MQEVAAYALISFVVYARKRRICPESELCINVGFEWKVRAVDQKMMSRYPKVKDLSCFSTDYGMNQ